MSDDERDRLDRLADRVGAIEARLTVAEERAKDRADQLGRVETAATAAATSSAAALGRIEAALAADQRTPWTPMQLAGIGTLVTSALGGIAAIAAALTGHPVTLPAPSTTEATPHDAPAEVAP